MSDDHVPLKTLHGTSDEAAAVMEIVNLWRATLAHFSAAEGDTAETIDPMRLSHAATAAAVLAGTFIGNAIVCGLMTDKDRRRATEVFARNFRSGIDIGKRQGFRVVSEMPVAGNA